MTLPDNRIRFPATPIDFETQVGVTYQLHDLYPAPNQQARYDWMRMYLIGLLSHQASNEPPFEFRNGTLWFNLDEKRFKLRTNDTWEDFAIHIGKILVEEGLIGDENGEIIFGEVNTARNVGDGSKLFKQKVGVELQFRTITPGSNKVIISEPELSDDEISIDISVGMSQLADYSAHNNRIINVSNPVDPQDAVTKSYVDHTIGTIGMSDLTDYDADNNRIINVYDPIDPQDAATKHYVDQITDNIGLSDLADYNADNNRIINVNDPVDPQDATTKSYVDQITDSIGLSNLSDYNADGNRLSGLADPSDPQDAVTKAYVDQQIEDSGGIDDGDVDGEFIYWNDNDKEWYGSGTNLLWDYNNAVLSVGGEIRSIQGSLGSRSVHLRMGRDSSISPSSPDWTIATQSNALFSIGAHDGADDREYLKFDHTNNYTIVGGSGMVGIGVDEPEAPLHIRRPAGSAFRSVLKLQRSDTDTLDISVTPDHVDISPHNDGLSDINIRFFRWSNITGTKRVQFMRGDGTLSSSAQIGVDGADSLFQLHDGNFGIGTDNPLSKLHVTTDSSTVLLLNSNTRPTGLMVRLTQGTIDIDATNSSDGETLYRFFRNLNSTANKRVQFCLGDGSIDVDSQITVDGSPTFFNAHGGNVGIGLSSPSTRLHIGNTIDSNRSYLSTSAMCVIGGHNDHQMRFFIDQTNEEVAIQAFLSGSSPNVPLRINPGGGSVTLGMPGGPGVGIRRTRPDRPLDVSGIIRTVSGDFNMIEIERDTVNDAKWTLGIEEQGQMCVRPRDASWGFNNIVGLTITRQGHVGINTANPVAAAALEVNSTTAGFLPPRMTSEQRNAIPNPPGGTIVYDLTLNKLCVREAGAWRVVSTTAV